MKAYLRKPGIQHDHLLGRAEDNGRVYRSYLGPDDEIGHVHLNSGKVYAQRLGNDEYIGRVDLDNGKIWRDVTAGPDEYIGRIESDASLAQAGAAFLLLVWPAFTEDQ